NSWTRLAPQDLPADAAAYLGPAVIVLDDVPADALTPAQLDRLNQYVRDLGGALILSGGPHAFGAGGYTGTALDAMSPLESDAPLPATRWVLLADSSGSMAAAAGSSTRWQLAVDALVKILPHLPPSDIVSTGSFARELRWWSTGKTARETAALSLPP